ncbi:hypothetical protein OV208_00650 [Corallococcus sp. bb12-1]|uniref:hypothetical protein n=1 Tax=Corallococcus sp. bb12-1 TaxID=2996784 RepID=UPI00227028C9|nr:hypothetical protein [Corallococcus sp. bb12-1]MCY1039808.1 hypothetical protein [Corallococcus sp. bb12-1]
MPLRFLLLLCSVGLGCQAADEGRPKVEEQPKALDCNATYVACGCGCCGGVAPEVRCLSCAQGADLQALIDADQEAAKSSNCPYAGCSTGIQYVYCDAPDLAP